MSTLPSPRPVHHKPDSGSPRRSGPAPIRASEGLRAPVAMVVSPRPERWQSAFVCPELDSAVVPSVRGQPGTPVSVRPGVQPWELPSPAVSAQGGQALVAAERAGQADQDGRPSGAALPAIDLSVVRGVGSSTIVPGSVGSYRPVIAGAKLREDTTTILPRGRALQGVGLSSMRFHPIGGGPEDDKDGQEAWFTARTASLIG